MYTRFQWYAKPNMSDGWWWVVVGFQKQNHSFHTTHAHLPKHTYFRVSVSDFVFFQDNVATHLAYVGKQSHAPVEAQVLLT